MPEPRCKMTVAELREHAQRFRNVQGLGELAYAHQLLADAYEDLADARESRWQPIETAPKDGTQILLWNGAHRFLAYWDKDFSSSWDEEREISIPVGAWTDGTVASWGYEENNQIKEPTHWMPLPEPPSEEVPHA